MILPSLFTLQLPCLLPKPIVSSLIMPFVAPLKLLFVL